MKCNAAGLAIVQSFESLELEAYPDLGSDLGKACTKLRLPMREYRKVPDWEKLKADPWTIGWGHCGPEVHQGLVWTKDHCDAVFLADVAAREALVCHCLKVPVTENQFSALIPFVFNVGIGNLIGHDLLRYINAGDFARAAAEFPLWNKSGGVPCPGLTRRREAERALFLSA